MESGSWEEGGAGTLVCAPHDLLYCRRTFRRCMVRSSYKRLVVASIRSDSSSNERPLTKYTPCLCFDLREQLGAKTLRTFHEAAGSAGSALRGPPRPPMRLSYYGGGHYDSVAPIDDRAPSGISLPPVGGVATATAMASEDLLETAGGTAGAVLPTTPEPGQLEDAALERSRRRAAEAGSGRWVHGQEQSGAEASLRWRLRDFR